MGIKAGEQTQKEAVICARSGKIGLNLQGADKNLLGVPLYFMQDIGSDFEKEVKGNRRFLEKE